MRISTKLRDKIEKALDDAFRKREQLRRALLNKLDCKTMNCFGYQELENEIPELIDSFERKGFLDELVIAAIRENRNNNKLLELEKDIYIINPDVNHQELSQEFDDLWSIIVKIPFDIIKTEFIQTLSHYNYMSEQKSDLEFKLDEVKKTQIIFSFIIKKTLISEIKNTNSDIKPIFMFAKSLAIHENIDDSVKITLKKWLKQKKNKHDLVANFSSNAQPYLFIIISPENEYFRVYAYLMPDHNNPQRIEPIESRKGETELERGIKCDSFEEIKHESDDLIRQSDALLDKFDVLNEPIIEFFLPIEYLHEKVEQWEYNDIWDKKLIGKSYAVVMRCSDQFKYRKLKRKLKRKRTIFNGLRQVLNHDFIQEHIYHLNELDSNSCDWSTLSYDLEEKIGLKLNCSKPKNDEIYTKLFRSIISSGVNIIVWEIPNTSEFNSTHKNDELLNLNSLSNLNNLFFSVRKRRREGHDVFLLCEDPGLDDLLLDSELTPP